MSTVLKKILLLFVLPIFVLIIGGLILDLLTSLDLSAIFQSTLASIISFFSTQILLWLTIVFLVVLLIIAFLAYLKRSRNHTTGKTKIDGICWEWGPPERTGLDWQLTPRCPECMYELQQPRKNDLLPDNLAAKFIPKCSLHCENCNFEKTFPCRCDILLEKIGKEIDRRIILKGHPFKRLCLFLKNK